MADVYLARDLLLDRPVAVKVLFAEHARDAAFVERFRREAQAAANLNQPNIVAVYDWGQQYGTYFIVMEYVEGRPLSEIIRTEGPLHPNRAAEITADVAAALGFAHRNGVVHRDVKPGNILITPSGQVKVADFGIAQAATTGDAAVNLTQAGSVMGTATYFSPEQAQGHAVDPRSDLYSLGCVLYEMLTARPPFAGDSPVAVAYKHVQEQPVPPSRINPNVPPALEAIDLKLLAKDPVQRFASAEDLRSDLRRFLEGQPVLAAGLPGAGAAAATGVVIGAGLAGAAAADATTIVPAASGAGGDGFGGPPTSGGGYAMPPEKKRTGLYVGLTIGALVLIGLILFFVGSNMGKTTEKVTVPDVTTLDVTAATNKLSEAGFKVSVKNVANDTVPANQVFEQTPKGNTTAEKGSTVEITVSSGIGDGTVPDVVGRTQAAAESLLKTNNFIPEVKEAASDTVPKGTVISQSPTANSKATKNSVVTITVSSGPGEVPVPNVINLSSLAASNQLGQAGFQVTIKQQSSATIASGIVISTNPAPGAKAAKNSTVEMTVSSGPEKVAVPNYTAGTTTWATYETALTNAGLVGAGCAVDANKISSTNPAQGTQVNKGSTVTVTCAP